MPQFTKLVAITIVVSAFISNTAMADVVLTFDQAGVFDSAGINPNYGDRVTSTSDGIGSYDIVAGSGELFTPNVEVSYFGGETRLWTTGYSDLTNVLFDDLDFNDGFEISFVADAGFEVGIFEFELGAFGAGETISGVEILDGAGSVLWSGGSTFVDGTSASSFNTGGIFRDSLTLSVDLTGLDGASDNIGIDNVRFAQRTSVVPEPHSGAILLLAGIFRIMSRRKSRRFC